MASQNNILNFRKFACYTYTRIALSSIYYKNTIICIYFAQNLVNSMHIWHYSRDKLLPETASHSELVECTVFVTSA